ncbi:MAG: hypothetical protein WC554_02955 [Clostridia bacterium]
MANKQKSGGGARKIGNHKEHCKRYKDMGRRFINKLKRFIKHNIAKNADDKEKQRLINDFKELEKKQKIIPPDMVWCFSIQ